MPETTAPPNFLTVGRIAHLSDGVPRICGRSTQGEDNGGAPHRLLELEHLELVGESRAFQSLPRGHYFVCFIEKRYLPHEE